MGIYDKAALVPMNYGHFSPSRMVGLRLNQHNMLAVRFSGQKKLSGYIALWGNRNKVDCVGTWFDKDNPPDLGLGKNRRDYSLFVPFRLKYEHGADEEVRGDIIGMVTRVWEDQVGIAFEGELFTDSPHYARISQELRDGRLATSSGSAEHLATFTLDNAFDMWNLAELSLTAFPCEATMPMVQLRSLKHFNKPRNYATTAAITLAADYHAFADPLLRYEAGEMVPQDMSGVVIGTNAGNEFWVVEYQNAQGQTRYYGFQENELEEGVALRRRNLKRAAFLGVQQGLKPFRQQLDYTHLPKPYDVVQDQSGGRWLIVAQQSTSDYVGIPYLAQTLDYFAQDYGIVGNLMTGVY